MADIFISYSKSEPEITERLAETLASLGYSIWWDTDLLSGEDYTEVIIRQLNAASAVIVIWTPKSIQSQWVAAEAERAAKQNKLITVMSQGVAAEDIPLPFNRLHTVLVDDIDRIVASLSGLSIRKSSEAATKSDRPQILSGKAAWRRSVNSHRAPKHESDFLAAHPADDDRVGDGVALKDIDVERAFPACEAAAERYPNEARFIHQLARVLTAKTEHEKALELFKRGASLGYPASMLSVGLLLDDETFPSYDPQGAMDWYERAAANGNAHAAYALGIKSVAAAFDWLQKAAERGDSNSMLILGKAHESGVFLSDPNFGQARKWYERAVAYGNSSAMLQLAQMCHAGNGIDRDLSYAQSLVVRAEQSDEPNVIYELVFAYANGTFTEHNADKAGELLLDAADLGHDMALYYIRNGMAGWRKDIIKGLQKALKSHGYKGAIDEVWNTQCEDAANNYLAPPAEE